MREITGDLWRLADHLKPDAVCITTNGFLKKNGEAVLGRGCALEAVQRWPTLPKMYGEMLHTLGLRVSAMLLPDQPYHLVAFPVKPSSVVVQHGATNLVKQHRYRFMNELKAPGWAAMADPILIKQSALQLVAMIEKDHWEHVLLPRPGCGNGGLRWDEIKPMLACIFDDRVSIVSN
jgi:hypothetical protein